MKNSLKKTFKDIITKLLDYNYPLSITWRHYLIKRLINDPLFIVYSDGKVGSTTITKSLKINIPNQFVFHIHRLTPESITEVENSYRSRYKSRFSEIPDNVIQSKFLLENWSKISNDYKVLFFSLVRDPIAAFISEYCENYPYAKKKLTHSEEEITSDIIQNIFNLIEVKKVHTRLDWFDRELNQALNFNIYNQEFDREKGYKIYEDKNLLILKLEALNFQCASAMKDFLGLLNFKIVKGNTAEESDRQNIYSKVKKSIKLPIETLDEIYNSKYIHYFYGDEEIRKFRERWIKLN